MKHLICLPLVLCSLICFSQLQQIPLKVSDAYSNQHARDDFSKLIDGDLSTKFTVWNAPIKPYRVYFDLYDYDKAIIKRLVYHINNGNPSTQKYYYVDKSGKEILFFSYNGGVWYPDSTKRVFDVPDSLQGIATKFIIESDGGDDFPLDVELYGDFIKKAAQLPVLQRSPLSKLMGVVVKPWDIDNTMFPEKQGALKDLGASRIRLYNDYILNHDDAGNIYANGPWRQMDNMKLLKSKGISTQMCYLSLPDNYPWPPTSDRTDPETYLKLAQDVFYFGQSNKENGEYFETLELLNEQDCWYCSDKSRYFDGYQLAAMLSICYDGHKGKFPGVGLKASGSTASFSVGGLAESEPYLLYQMIEWSQKNRGYRPDGTVDLPFDIYSFHCYSSLEGQLQGTPGGISPEYGMLGYFEKLNIVRKRYAPWLKIHVGEWGWDVNPGSTLNAPAFSKYSSHQASAMFTVRALLLMASTGMDAASYYRICQDYNASDADPTIFATMALLRRHNEMGVKQPDGSYLGFDIKRTLTGDYFKQLSEVFNSGYSFDTMLSTSPYVLRFTKEKDTAYAIWQSEAMTITDRPQFTERTVNYNLNVKGKLRRFVDDSSGVMSSENFAGGNITIDSKPIFVFQTNVPLPPTVSAADKTVAWPQNTSVTLDCQASDPDGSIVRYAWTKISGLPCIIVSPTKAATSVIGLTKGTYYFRITVTDNDGKTASKDVQVTVDKSTGPVKKSGSITTATSSGLVELPLQQKPVVNKVVVYNTMGQEIKTGGSSDVEKWKKELSHGVYLFQYFLDNGDEYTEKFLKQY